MPYIYKITNQINNKIYIGKTIGTIEKRWNEHCKDYQRRECENRPLYAAMQKYGIENFKIEEVEECSDIVLNERERYWIEYYGSFKFGYNATKGGDGRAYIDYDLVVATYNELGSLKETADRLKIDRGHISTILKAKQINILSGQEVNRNKHGIPVNQYDLQGNYIQTFPSIKSAVIQLGVLKSPQNRGCIGHVGDVCKGKRKTAYGYIWKYANIDQQF